MTLPADAARDEQSRTAHLAGLDTQDRAREERAAQERDQLAAERQARIREARARLDRRHAHTAPVRARARRPRPGPTGAGRRPHMDTTPRMDRPGPGRYATRDEGHARAARVSGRTARSPTPAPTATDASTPRARRSPATGAPAPTATAMPSPDVGLYRAVSYTDMAEQHYDGHPYVARRAVTRMVRAGLMEEHEATGPQGNTFTVLTATQRGRDAAHRAALDAGHVPEQETWTGLVKPGRAVARHGRVPRGAGRAGAH